MIDRIVIDNFKSIKHADVKLQQVNLLIGPNNSGKSNFLKVFEAIGDYTDDFGNVNSFNFESKEGTKADIQIHLTWGGLFFESTHPTLAGHFFTHTLTDDSLALNYLKELKKSRIYKINVDRIKDLKPLNIEATSINKNADNIASFLQIALNRYRDIFNKITVDLVNLTNQFKEVVLDIGPGNYIKLGLRDSINQFWVEELSEGVLYFLAILCIIHQPNPPKLLLIEEPENGIHPRRIKEIIDLIKQLALEKDIQVIMTSHSPLVVNLFADEPESIFVFDMKDGFTDIKNLQTDIIEPTNKELQEKGIDSEKDYNISLGDQWVYGLLGGVPV